MSDPRHADKATIARIAVLETTAADALPSAVYVSFDGWRLRFNHAVTRRANSVLAEAAGGLGTNSKIEAAEAFYAGHGVPPRFQLSPASRPSQLDALLQARGYRHEPGALVQVRAILAAAPLPPSFSVGYQPLPSAAWLELLAAVDSKGASRAEARANALLEAGSVATHALVAQEGVPVAVGLGVLGSGQVGLFNMATHPDHRRRGAATAVMAGLADWARSRGAHGLYLQVDERNSGGHAFYARMGFTTLYRYHYRVLMQTD